MGVMTALGYQLDPVVGLHLQLRRLGWPDRVRADTGTTSSASSASAEQARAIESAHRISNPAASDIGARVFEFRLRRMGPVGGLVVAPPGWIDRADATTADLLGASDPIELEGRHLTEFLVDSQDVSDISSAITEVSENSSFIVELRRVDGSVFTAGISLRMHRRESDRGLIGSVMALA